MPVLRLIAVRRRFVRNYRHQPHLGVLLLHQVFAGLSLDLATEKQLEAAVQCIPRHRVLGPQELGRKAKPRTDETPGRRGFAQDGVTLGGLELDDDTGEVFAGTAGVVHLLAHRGLELPGVGLASPLEAGDMAGDLHRLHARQ